MTDPFREDALVNWVGDFLGSDRLGLFPQPVQQVAQGVLETFLVEACAVRDVSPADLDRDDCRIALLEHVAGLAVDGEARPFIPSLCRAFLEFLQDQGRLGSGHALGRAVGALKEAFLAANPGRQAPFRRAGSKIGRNDPCPCGSGLKYKKCHGA